MKQVNVRMSTYTADVSGICSALYELGGMVVIHDPSGCNSTYNTHDEPRWFDMDSLVFITGLSEIDAIMGNDDKFIHDVVNAARDLQPRFIALVRTPIPMMIGTDFEAIAQVIEDECGIPTWYFPTNGMHSYVQGVNMALKHVAEKLTDEIIKTDLTAGQNWQSRNGKLRINLLGVTPLDFSINSTRASMQEFLYTNGCEIISTFAMGSSVEEIAMAGKADVNLVVSSCGYEAARVLYQKFGTPYLAAAPVDGLTDQVLEQLRKAAEDGICMDQLPWKKQRLEDGDLNRATEARILKEDDITQKTGGKIVIIGEAVISQSLAKVMELISKKEVQVIASLETPKALLEENTLNLRSEEEIVDELKKLSNKDVIVADPMFRALAPQQVKLVEFPHEAYSGRIYRKYIPDLMYLEEFYKNIIDS